MSTQETNETVGRSDKHGQQNHGQTGIERSLTHKIRCMVGQIILARACRAQGDQDGYQRRYDRAREIAQSIKLEIDDLFETYRGELLDER